MGKNTFLKKNFLQKCGKKTVYTGKEEMKIYPAFRLKFISLIYYRKIFKVTKCQ
jgi:hypothetical protein